MTNKLRLLLTALALAAGAGAAWWLHVAHRDAPPTETTTDPTQHPPGLIFRPASSNDPIHHLTFPTSRPATGPASRPAISPAKTTPTETRP
jgi:hypothetical protein